jgi:hypothetical protein
LHTFGFVDMSGGSNDDVCLAIAHKESGRAVLDLCINQGTHPPFDPMKAVNSFGEVLKEYRLSRVTGDRYAGETFKAAFQKKGINYHVSELTKHEIYEAVEVLFNTGTSVLLDHEVMESQFMGLVWRGSRIDHLPGEHDDYCNAAAGVLHLASENVATHRGFPIGIGTGIGTELRRRFGSTLRQPMLDSTFGLAPEERRPNTGCAALFRFDFGPDNSQEPGGYVSRTGRRKKFPSID